MLCQLINLTTHLIPFLARTYNHGHTSDGSPLSGNHLHLEWTADAIIYIPYVNRLLVAIFHVLSILFVAILIYRLKKKKKKDSGIFLYHIMPIHQLHPSSVMCHPYILNPLIMGSGVL